MFHKADRCSRPRCLSARGVLGGWLLLALPLIAQGQGADSVLTERQAVRTIVQRHPTLASTQAALQRQQQLRRTALNLPQPELIGEAPSGTFYTLGVTQRLESPLVYARQRQLAEQVVAAAEQQVALARAALTFRARQAYLEGQYWAAQRALLTREDSLLQGFVAAAELRYRLGQARYLDQLSGATRARLVRQQRDVAQAQYAASLARLGLLLGQPPTARLDSLRREPARPAPGPDSAQLAASPARRLAERLVEQSRLALRLERARIGPALSMGYLNQGETPANPARMNFRFGLTVPLWWWEPQGRIAAARAQLVSAEAERRATELALTDQWIQLRAELAQAEQTLATFDGAALRQADELIRASGESYRLGESNYLAYLTSLEQAFTIQRAYLDALRAHRLAQLALDLLAGRTDADLE